MDPLTFLDYFFTFYNLSIAVRAPAALIQSLFN